MTFAVNSDVVLSGLYNELDRIAQILVKYPQTSIVVEGHTDSNFDHIFNEQRLLAANG